MNFRKEATLGQDSPLRPALAARNWDSFTYYSIEMINAGYDRHTSILAFEGAIAKLGITTGYACFTVTGPDLGPSFSTAMNYYVLVA